MEKEVEKASLSIDYKDCYVAFIDVLNFRNILKSKSHTERYFSHVAQTIGPVIEQLREDYSAFSRFVSYSLVSDSIVIAIECGKEPVADLCFFLKLCKSIQLSLLMDVGIWVRGGISKGDFFANSESNIVVGDGLVRAYDLEKIASSPRILIDPLIPRKLGYKTLRHFVENMNSIAANDKPSEKVIFDKFDNTYLAVPSAELDGLHVDWFNGFGGLDQTRRDVLKDVIQESVMSEQEHLKKYRWVVRYLMGSVYGIVGVPSSEKDSLIAETRKWIDTL